MRDGVRQAECPLPAELPEQLLRGYLGERFKSVVPVAYAMRYGKPSIGAGLAELAEKGASRIVVIPMYPQYAGSTTGNPSRNFASSNRQKADSGVTPAMSRAFSTITIAASSVVGV